MATAISDSYGAEPQTLVGRYEGGKVVGGDGDDRIYADGDGFTKDSFPGLILWLDASDASTLNFKTGQWNDKSGHGNNTTNMCSPTNFHFTPAHIGTRDAVALEQTGNCLQLPNLDADHLTIYLVQAKDKAFTLYSMEDGGWQIGVNHPTKEEGFLLRKLNGATAKSSLKTNGNVVGVTYDGSAATFYSSGQAGEKVTYKNDHFNSSGSNYAFGSPSNIVSELLVFNTALTPQNRQVLQEYLAHKYHIPLLGKHIGVNFLSGGQGADKFIWTENSSFNPPSSNREVYDQSGRNLDMVKSYGPDTFDWDGMTLRNVTIDHITDFSGMTGGQQDKIDISGFELSGPMQVTGLGRLSGIPNQLVWFQSNIHTIVQFDRDGDRRPDWEIVLEAFNAADLRVEDFILPTK